MADVELLSDSAIANEQVRRGLSQLVDRLCDRRRRRNHPLTLKRVQFLAVVTLPARGWHLGQVEVNLSHLYLSHSSQT